MRQLRMSSHRSTASIGRWIPFSVIRNGLPNPVTNDRIRPMAPIPATICSLVGASFVMDQAVTQVVTLSRTSRPRRRGCDTFISSLPAGGANHR